jgi:hypothetical protein
METDALIGRKRALDRAMDEALRNPNARRRKAGGIVSLFIYVIDSV